MFIVAVLGITLALSFLAFLVSGMHQFCLHCNLYARIKETSKGSFAWPILPFQVSVFILFSGILCGAAISGR